MVAICIFIYRPPSESVYASIFAAVRQNHPCFTVYVAVINPIAREQESYLEKFCNSLPNVWLLNRRTSNQWQSNTWKLFLEDLHENVEYVFALNDGAIIGEGCLESAVKLIKESDLTLAQFAHSYWGTLNLTIARNQDFQANFCTNIIRVKALDSIENLCAIKFPDWEELRLRLNAAGHKVAVME